MASTSNSFAASFRIFWYIESHVRRKALFPSVNSLFDVFSFQFNVSRELMPPSSNHRLARSSASMAIRVLFSSFRVTLSPLTISRTNPSEPSHSIRLHVKPSYANPCHAYPINLGFAFCSPSIIVRAIVSNRFHVKLACIGSFSSNLYFRSRSFLYTSMPWFLYNGNATSRPSYV